MPTCPRRRRAAFLALVASCLTGAGAESARGAADDSVPLGGIRGTVTWSEDTASFADVVLMDLDGTTLETRSVTSGDWYQFYDLAPGRYVVGFAYDSDFSSRWDEDFLRELYPDAHSWADARPVDVRAGAISAGIDATLDRRLTPDESTIEIAGRVTDASGEPLPGVQVGATAQATAPFQTPQQRTVVTDAQGRYGFDDLDPSPDTSRDLVLRFTDPGPGGQPREWPSDDFSLVTQWSRGVESVEQRQPVTVPQSGSVVVDASLRRHGTVEVLASPATRGLDSGVRMTVVDVSGTQVTATRTWSLDDGAELRITGLRPAPYYLRFDGDGIPTTWWPGVPDREQATTVSVPEGAVTRGLSVVLGDPPPPPTVLRSLTAPRITGEPVVGGVLQVDAGTWSLDAVDHRVDWMVEGQVLRSGRWMYPTPDLRGRSVSARLTTTHQMSGQEVVTDLPPVSVPRLSSSAEVSSRLRRQGKRADRLDLTLTLRTADPLVEPVGEVVLLERGRVLSRAAARHRVAIRLRGVKPGRHVYVVRYAGSTAIAPTETRVVVRVTKSRAGRGGG